MTWENGDWCQQTNILQVCAMSMKAVRCLGFPAENVIQIIAVQLEMTKLGHSTDKRIVKINLTLGSCPGLILTNKTGVFTFFVLYHIFALLNLDIEYSLY